MRLPDRYRNRFNLRQWNQYTDSEQHEIIRQLDLLTSSPQGGIVHYKTTSHEIHRFSSIDSAISFCQSHPGIMFILVNGTFRDQRAYEGPEGWAALTEWGDSGAYRGFLGQQARSEDTRIFIPHGLLYEVHVKI